MKSKSHINCKCGETFTFLGSVTGVYTCPKCGVENLTHEAKVKFHNAIVNLSNRYFEIGKKMDVHARALCKMECRDITPELAKQILNELPDRLVDSEENAVEFWMQTFFS